MGEGSPTLEHRFLPATQRAEMLAACGVKSFEDLLKGIPAELRFRGDLGIGHGLCELDIRRKMRGMFRESRDTRHGLSFLGAGVYEHFCPAAVNQLTLRGEFLTAYTPYQPEIAQGTLMALFEFQTMVAELFGMDVANASHYDGSTAMAEAALMTIRIGKGRNRVLVSEGVHPEYVGVLRTYLSLMNAELTMVPLDAEGRTDAKRLKAGLDDTVAGLIVQSPNFCGVIEHHKTLADMAHEAGSLYVAGVLEPMSLGVVKAPGEAGADIVVGEGQGLGIPVSFGGPLLGLFAARKEHVRQMPGRLCGETVDAQGRRSYCLTLSTREQHIRREKATSNICTNQNLMALWATVWMSLVGAKGLQQFAEQNLAKAEYAKQALVKTGKVKLRYPTAQTFNEFVLDVPSGARKLFDQCAKRDIAAGVPLERFSAQDKTGLLVAFTEVHTREDIDALVAAVRELA